VELFVLLVTVIVAPADSPLVSTLCGTGGRCHDGVIAMRPGNCGRVRDGSRGRLSTAAAAMTAGNRGHAVRGELAGAEGIAPESGRGDAGTVSGGVWASGRGGVCVVPNRILEVQGVESDCRAGQTEGNTEGRGLRIRLKVLEAVVEVGEGVDRVQEARVLGVVKIDKLRRGSHVCGCERAATSDVTDRANKSG